MMEENIKVLKRKEKGITLIALVITIIVLLILAGVSIAMLTGDNGIITQAKNAKEETEKASIIEQAQIDILGIQAGNNTAITQGQLKGVLDKYFENVPDDIDTDDTLITKEEYGGKYQIAVSDIYNGDLKVIPSMPEGLKIGTKVSYNPSGTYDWNSIYCSSPENKSYAKTLNSADGQPFNIKTWKVFDIDDSTGTITLVPEHSTDDRSDGTSQTSGTVYLYGVQGYNNAVKMLNDACNELYGDSDKGITARSININDIEVKMKDEALTTVHNYSNSGTVWGQQLSALNAYISSNSYYPSIYTQEALRSDNNGNRINYGLGISEQINLIKPTDNNATDGYLQGTSIRPTQTYWNGKNDFMKDAFEIKDGINYYNLLMPDDINTYYWIASRCVNIFSDYCSFSVRNVYKGEMSYYYMFDSNSNNSPYNYYGLFPLVSLNISLITGNSVDGFSVK